MNKEFERKFKELFLKKLTEDVEVYDKLKDKESFNLKLKQAIEDAKKIKAYA